MTDKASSGGWVVQVMTPGAGTDEPSYRYFSVAIPIAEAAVAVVRELHAVDGAQVRPVGPLSAADILGLNLAPGELKPA
jgi:hypothetical protein